MAKTTAPLLSFGASGQIGKTQVYSKWKGRSYVRRHVIPANPQTADQTLTRSAFAFLQSVYKFAPALVTAAWDAYAKGLVMTSRNAFTSQNLPLLRTASNLNDFIGSPGALGGLPPTSITAPTAAGHTVVTIVEPTDLPIGWSILTGVLCMIRDGDPQSSQNFVILSFEDAATPFTHDFTGLAAGVYQAFGFLTWMRPDGKIAYSPSIIRPVTVT